MSFHYFDVPDNNNPIQRFLNRWNIWACIVHASCSLSSLIYEWSSDFSLLTGWTESRKYSTAIPYKYKCLFPPQCWICISIPVVPLIFFVQSLFNFIFFLWIITKKIISILPTIHLTKNNNISTIWWKFLIAWM